MIASLRIFFSGAWLAFVGLFHWTSPMNYLASKIVMPINSILFFTLLGTSATGVSNSDFYVIGNAMQVAAINGIYGVTMCVGNERDQGTLIYVLGTPANRFVTFVGRALFNVIDGIITVVLGFIWGVVLLGLDLSTANLPGLALAILVSTASTCGMGLLLGSVALVALNVMFINNTVYFLLLLFSGANLPLQSLPVWMQTLSSGLPLTRGIAAARLLVRGASLAEVAPLLLGELAVGLVYALLGFSLFSWFEFQAKRRGTLEAF
jgi:ABC-2 type transport system permease protein